MTGDRQTLINDIMMSCLPVLSDEQADHVRNTLAIKLNSYNVERCTTDIVEYQGNEKELLLRKFLIAKRVNGCTERTIKMYGDYLKRSIYEISKPISQITTDDIRYYLALKETRDGVSKVSLNNERRVLSTFFTFLQDEEIISKNPVRGISNIKGKQRKKNAFTEMEIEQLRQACSDERISCMIEILLSTGCRVSELCGIKLTDISADTVLVHGKGQKDRVCYLNAKALISISSYVELRNDSNPYLFASSKYDITYTEMSSDMRSRNRRLDWWKHADLVSEDRRLNVSSVEAKIRNLGKDAGVPHTHPHRFRRTCATMALRHGMPIEQVSKMLGHEQISTTQIYLDLSEEDLKISHRKFVV